MNNEIVIDVQNVSKSYKLYDRTSDRLRETIHPFKKKYHREFYALKDVSFKIKKGETVGIIGKNGAGKSTLLKIITGVLTPSSGSVTVNGKVASLLELGVGFNPEFTGMENIYLNGTIMGYTKAEMDDRLPAILEFADIGDFIFQPVKTYSSGMYVRLAFSLAINVEPDVLIVDEALGVGDAKFQLKCFKRLEYLKAKGMTILFVTHDVATTKKLCSWAMLMDGGRLISIGEPKDIIMEYLELLFPNSEEAPKVAEKKQTLNQQDCASRNEAMLNEDRVRRVVPAGCNSFGIGGADIEYLLFRNMPLDVFSGGEEIDIDVQFKYDKDYLAVVALQQEVKENLIIGVSISDAKGTYLFGMTTYDKNIYIGDADQGTGKVRFTVQMPYLQSGDYLFNCAIALGTQESHVQLKWYDGIDTFKMQSSKRYVYGVFYQEYEAKEGGKGF